MKCKWFIWFSTKNGQIAHVSQRPSFGWYPKWIELDKETGQPNSIKYAMRQPPTIELQCSTPNRCKMSCEVVPDMILLFIPVYVLMYTIPNLRDAVPLLETEPQGGINFISLKFYLFQRCLQEVAVTKWDLCNTKYPNNKQMEETLQSMHEGLLQGHSQVH